MDTNEYADKIVTLFFEAGAKVSKFDFDKVVAILTQVRQEERLDTLLPAHEASLHITHNQHKAYYESAEEYLAEQNLAKDVPKELVEAMIKADSIWELQWYPNTPIGFNIVYGPTLQSVLDQATLPTEGEKSNEYQCAGNHYSMPITYKGKDWCSFCSKQLPTSK